VTATPTLTQDALADIRTMLQKANAQVLATYPGESSRRQPVHTVYGGAHLFTHDTAKKLGALACASLETYAPTGEILARALGFPEALGARVHARVKEKLLREAVEDFRIDYEDGFGHRPDAEEDTHAVGAAAQVAKGLAEKTLPPFIGLRLKSFSDELFPRAARTLDLFLTTLLEKAGRLPDNFVVTLPKVTHVAQVSALVTVLERLEEKLGLAKGSLKLELMVETTQSILGPDGKAALPSLVAAAQGRCVGAHFGTYDYTASSNITAEFQTMAHPACDFAKHVMQVTLAGTGMHLSDGATNVMPVPPHRAEPGKALTKVQEEENRAAVHKVWRLNYRHVRHSLEGAFYQGWDLHPAQLPVRYAAVYAFFLEGLEAAQKRLLAFMDKAAQATLLGDVFDDAATGQGLLNFFLRGLACGALTEEEARGAGLSLEELKTRSFLKILEGRRKR
jgi:hypothetical protein